MLPPFKNEPLTDFSQPDRAAAYRQALAQVRRGFGGHQPLIIGGREVDTGDCMASLNPCEPGEVIGTVAAAGSPEVDRALRRRLAGFSQMGPPSAGGAGSGRGAAGRRAAPPPPGVGGAHDPGGGQKLG